MPVLQWFKDQLKNKIIRKSSTSCQSSWKLVSLGLRLLALNLSTGSQYELTKTHHSLPWWASYGVSLVSLLEKDIMLYRGSTASRRKLSQFVTGCNYTEHLMRRSLLHTGFIQSLLSLCILVFYHWTYMSSYQQCKKLGKIFTSPTCKLILSFMVISDVYRSFIPNKTTFTKYCLTQVDFKALQLWNPLSKGVPGKFHGSGRHRVPTKISEKKFHDFSMTSPGQNPNFHTKIPIFVFATHVSITDRHRRTLTLTDTHMIWSRPTDYSTDFTGNWTDSRSQNYTC